jgi:hypothetical protein
MPRERRSKVRDHPAQLALSSAPQSAQLTPRCASAVVVLGKWNRAPYGRLPDGLRTIDFADLTMDKVDGVEHYT